MNTFKYFYDYQFNQISTLQNFKIFFLLVFCCQCSVGQEVLSKNLKGKVSSNAPDLEGIYISNLKNNEATLTDKSGYFAIKASIGDTLQFSALQFVGLKLELQKEDFTKQLLLVKLETMINVLDEVKINQYKNINSVSLGLVPKNQKQYTPAERRLRGAGEFKWYSPLLIPLGGMSVDGLLNAISGRKSQLKKELQIEKKEFLIIKIDNTFQENHFTDVLKIPAEYVNGFKFYIVEDEKFVAAMKNNNKTMATFLMGELAVEYLKIIKTD